MTQSIKYLLIFQYITLIIFIVIISLIIIYTLISNDATTDAEPTEKKYYKIIFSYNNDIKKYVDYKAFISSLPEYNTIKSFLTGSEKENTLKLINWYYPESKIIKIDL